MASVVSFPVVEQTLDASQHLTDREKSFRVFLQRLYLSTKKLKFFFLGLVTFYHCLVTSWSVLVPLWFSFLGIRRLCTVTVSLLSLLEKLWII